MLSMRLGCITVAIMVLCLHPAIAADKPIRGMIDAELAAAWTKQKVTPAKTTSDSQFLRRVFLDLTGNIPSYDEAKAFLEDTSADKRAKLVDRLLSDSRYAQHQADLWDMVLFGRNPPGSEADRREGFQTWLKSKFEKNTPYDQWARELLKAEGTTADSSTMYYVQYRNAPEDAIESITQTFLGVQLQCARCHDHPFDEWKQRDFFGMAAFLARLDVVTVGQKGNASVFTIGERNLGDVRFTGPAKDAKPGDKGEAVKPKFLHGDALAEPAMPKDFKEDRFTANRPPPKPKFSRKDALADWITKADNPYFAREAVNRIWAQLMGRGIVHPVDNLSNSNAPSHRELLDEMTKQFVANKFDIKWLIREIVNSKAYQLSSEGSGEAAPQWFQHARSRPLSAEELIESWRIAAGFGGVEKAGAKPDRYRPLGNGYLVQFFGNPNNGTGDFQGGLREHLYLNNGPLSQLITVKGGLAEFVGDQKKPMAERVERLFLSTLSRRPNEAESKKFADFLSSSGTAADAVWVLLTCAEFRFNH